MVFSGLTGLVRAIFDLETYRKLHDFTGIKEAFILKKLWCRIFGSTIIGLSSTFLILLIILLLIEHTHF